MSYQINCVVHPTQSPSSAPQEPMYYPHHSPEPEPQHEMTCCVVGHEEFDIPATLGSIGHNYHPTLGQFTTVAVAALH